MNRKKLFTKQTISILIVSLFLLVTGNQALWSSLQLIYPVTSVENALHLLSIVLFFTVSTYLTLLIFIFGRIGKWVLATIVMVSSLAAYYMDHFGIVVDVEMIRNIAESNPKEIAGLLGPLMVAKFVLFGLIPAILIINYWPETFKNSLGNRIALRFKLIGLLIVLLIVTVAMAPANFASFVREHKITRIYANPLGWIYSSIKFGSNQLKSASANHPLVDTAVDAKIVGHEHISELIIMVVGETARADRFSLNGYSRETNPELKKRDVLSFTNVTSCGTSTAESVPCMFSVLNRREFSRDIAKYHKNALDVLFERGVQVIWRDNNSDSKDVALRVKYADFSSPNNNPICNPECRDAGMLYELENYIDARKGKDIIIVLHQMGNHGPEYYKRYPEEFEYFKPACKTKELGRCSSEEINNAYDNAIRYTDYFLASAIDLLKKYDSTHATAMLYVSDHGESLGEHGLYLHAAPYAIAPKEQTHIPAILWTGSQFDYPMSMIKPYLNTQLSHDDLYCSLLIAFEVKTETCKIKESWLKLNPEISSKGIRY